MPSPTRGRRHLLRLAHEMRILRHRGAIRCGGNQPRWCRRAAHAGVMIVLPVANRSVGTAGSDIENRGAPLSDATR